MVGYEKVLANIYMNLGGFPLVYGLSVVCKLDWKLVMLIL